MPRESQVGQYECVAYVVPDDEYLDRLVADPAEERKRMQRWRKTFDLSQLGKEARGSQPGFNIAGWNSSYTKQPIPAEEMKEWVELTVGELLKFRPQRILEIGCGTGLLLLRIAPGRMRYVGTDFAPAVLKQLRQQLRDLAGPWDNVDVLERSAEDFNGFDDNSFDTVILNSVVKYFPSASYLVHVLEHAIRVTELGGRIFVGDVRNLTLLEPFAVSVELYQAPEGMKISELRERTMRRVLFEDQLVISPAFFLALQQQFSKISRVEIKPRDGSFDNELTRFRYNAILHLEPGRPITPEITWIEWNEQQWKLTAMRDFLQKEQPEIAAFKAIANARVEHDVRASAILEEWEGGRTVDDFRNELRDTPIHGIDPHSLWSMGEELGYHTDVSWARNRSDGSYDTVFCKCPNDGKPNRGRPAWPEAPVRYDAIRSYATMPGRAALREALVRQLYEREQQLTGGSSIRFVVMDSLLRSSDGKLDHSAISSPDVHDS